MNASKIADRTAEIAIQRKLLGDYISMVEQAAVCADPELYCYILRAVTEGTTFVVLKSIYGIPCERDMFYDRRRKFYWVLSGVREIYKEYYEKSIKDVSKHGLTSGFEYHTPEGST